jgi:hypothetical protein
VEREPEGGEEQAEGGDLLADEATDVEVAEESDAEGHPESADRGSR